MAASVRGDGDGHDRPRPSATARRDCRMSDRCARRPPSATSTGACQSDRRDGLAVDGHVRQPLDAGPIDTPSIGPAGRVEVQCRSHGSRTPSVTGTRTVRSHRRGTGRPRPGPRVALAQATVRDGQAERHGEPGGHERPPASTGRGAGVRHRQDRLEGRSRSRRRLAQGSSVDWSASRPSSIDQP